MERSSFLSGRVTPEIKAAMPMLSKIDVTAFGTTLNLVFQYLKGTELSHEHLEQLMKATSLKENAAVTLFSGMASPV
jgi:hypothetical protein